MPPAHLLELLQTLALPFLSGIFLALQHHLCWSATLLLVQSISIKLAPMAGRHAGGDVLTNVFKSCSQEQAPADLERVREGHRFQGGRREWLTQNLRIGQIWDEVVINGYGHTSTSGVISKHSDSLNDTTIYLQGHPQLVTKDNLVILLDLVIDCLKCSTMVIALELKSLERPVENILYDLSWVGFELISPDAVVNNASFADKHIFVGIAL